MYMYTHILALSCDGIEPDMCSHHSCSIITEYYFLKTKSGGTKGKCAVSACCQEPYPIVVSLLLAVSLCRTPVHTLN